MCGTVTKVDDEETTIDDGCGALNYAAIHNCKICGEPFGKPCGSCGKYRFWRDWQRAESRCDQCVKGEEAAEEERRAERDGRALMDLFEVGYESKKGNQVAVAAGFRWWRDKVTGRVGAFTLQSRDRQVRSQIADYGLGTMPSDRFIGGVKVIAERAGYRLGGNDGQRLELGTSTLAAAERAHRLIDAGIRARAEQVRDKYR